MNWVDLQLTHIPDVVLWSFSRVHKVLAVVIVRIITLCPLNNTKCSNAKYPALEVMYSSVYPLKLISLSVGYFIYYSQVLLVLFFNINNISFNDILQVYIFTYLVISTAA